MDGAKLKLCQSLRWLAGVVHEQAPDLRTDSVSQLLLNPCGEYSHVSAEVVTLLTNPSLYFTAYDAIFPGERLEGSGESFWPLIHGLARRGIYILENDEVAVNHSVLAQHRPFREASHLALLDGLMTAHAASIVTVERVVKSVRQVSSFNPSKDLPCNVQDSLLLWMNKVSESVCSKHKDHVSKMLQDPDTRQRRRNRLKLVNEQSPCIPSVSDLCSGIVDGRCLAALLLHYAPQVTKWSDFHFSDESLSQSQCLHNLSKVCEFCSTHLPPPAFHLTPETLLRFGQTDLLRTNIVALLSHLFCCLEIRGLNAPQIKSPPSVTSGGIVATTAHGKATVGKQPLHESLSSKRSVFRKDRSHGNQRSPVAKVSQRLSLSSYSTSDLPSQYQAVGGAGAAGLHGSQHRRLSSYSTSDLLGSSNSNRTDRASHLGSGSTVFNAPIRGSLTGNQAVALAGFRQTRMADAQSSAADNRPLPGKRGVITASTESLRIREQMEEEVRRRGRLSTRQPGPPAVRYTTSLNTSDGGSHSTTSSYGSSVELSKSASEAHADVSGNCTGSWTPTSVTPNPLRREVGLELPHNLALMKQGGPARDRAKSAASTGLVLPFSSDVPLSSTQARVHDPVNSSKGTDAEVRRSVTLSKHHTLASASAAGLPIIAVSDHTHGQSLGSGHGQDGTNLGSYTQSTSKLKIKEVAHASPVQTSPNPNGQANLMNIHESMSAIVSHASKPLLPSCEVRSSSSSSASTSSTPTLVHLRLHSNPPNGVCREPLCSFVPKEMSELRRQFRVRETAIRRQQVALDQQLEKERQKFHQRVFFALVQHQQEGPPGTPPMAASVEHGGRGPAQLPTVAAPEARAANVELHLATNGLLPADNGARALTTPSPPRPVQLDSSSSTPSPPPPPRLLPLPPPPLVAPEPTHSLSRQRPAATPLPNYRHVSDSDSDSDPRLPESSQKHTSWVVECSTGKKPSQPTIRRESYQKEQFSPILPLGCSKPAGSKKEDKSSDAQLGFLVPAHNPWSQPAQEQLEGRETSRHGLLPASQGMSKEEVLRRRELQVRVRLEEREKARKTTMEQRRKGQALTSAFQGLTKAEPVRQPGQLALEATEETIHFKLSSQQQAGRLGVPIDPSLAPSSSASTSYLPFSHDGPECYTKPKAKSNRKLIKNAVCYVCLAGEVNMSIKQKALAELEASTASHFMVLFRDTVGFKFRALYSYVPENEHITKVFGSGPKVIRKHMISRVFKYNSGSKGFKELLTKSFSLSVDALTMQNEYWIGKKSKLPPGAYR